MRGELPFSSGEEQDLLTPWRHVMKHSRGRARRAKNGYRRRVRRWVRTSLLPAQLAEAQRPCECDGWGCDFCDGGCRWCHISVPTASGQKKYKHPTPRDKILHGHCYWCDEPDKCPVSHMCKHGIRCTLSVRQEPMKLSCDDCNVGWLERGSPRSWTSRTKNQGDAE